MIIRTAILATLFSSLSGCQSAPYKEFNKVEIGIEKGRVLEILGNPDHRYRKNDTDRWVYRFPEGKEPGKFIEKEIWFQNSRVVYRDQNAAAPKIEKKPTTDDFEPVN